MSILGLILLTGVTGFTLFLLSYASFSIFRRGKLKRKEQEAKIEMMKTISAEYLLKNADDSLKREIDEAINNFQFNNQVNNTQQRYTAPVINNDFSRLTNKIIKLIEKGVDFISDKIDKKSTYDHFSFKPQDDFNTSKNEIKQKVLQIINKELSKYDSYK